jgi:bla regulator protein BlaR1
MIPAYLAPLANHLWQSTIYALIVGLLTMTLKKNRAAVRHRLWLAASIKFLVPFSLLVSVGSQFHWQTAPPVAPPPLSLAMTEIGQPFASQVAISEVPAPVNIRDRIPSILFCLWLVGAVVSLAPWFSQWRHIRRKLSTGKPMHWDIPIRVMSCQGSTEPGVFGVFRPVLLLPDGIADRLTPSELQAILAHELCHVRRWDNLSSLIHMVVEFLFWFHPLVWWIETRMIKEQENACDEEVMRLGCDPQVYAEGILKVCRLYLASPLACVAKVTGSDLRKRVEVIMKDGAAEKLTHFKKLALVAAGVTSLTMPIVFGFRYAPELKAQAQAAEQLAFEVASVKLNKSEPAFSGAARAEKEAMLQRMALQYLPGGRFSARGVPIPILIFEAYGVSPGRITFSPESEKSVDVTGESDRYDIEAVAEKGAIPANGSPEVRMQKIRLMLQSLLADRFKVRISHETKEVPVYAIIVGKNGPKLQKSAMDEARCAASSDDKPQIARLAGAADPTSCHAFVGDQGRGLRGQAVDMSDLAQAIEVFADRPVVNQTGLNGLFKIDVPGWTPLGTAAEERAFADPARPTISDVLQHLGLRLVPTKAAVEMFVVEHFERPTPN